MSCVSGPGCLCFNIHLKKKTARDLVINHNHPETGTCLRPHTYTQSSSDYGSLRINIRADSEGFFRVVSPVILFNAMLFVVCFLFPPPPFFFFYLTDLFPIPGLTITAETNQWPMVINSL